MEPFIVGVDITDVKNLYGRKRQIDILTSCGKRRGNAGITGSRRFGKTCLLKSLENHMRHSDEFDAYPIYFDVKTQTGIKKDTPAVYRSLAALLASKMCSDGMLSEGNFQISRRCTLDVSDDQLDMLVQMKNWNPEYQKEVLFCLANKIAETGKYLLLLLDEIDYLLLEALESPSDFSRIRGAATDKNCYLKFWVAGTATWSSICTTVGSPELNCGLENVSLPPLTKEEFKEMWEQECSYFDDLEKKNIFLSFEDTIYNNTGGIPYYAKFVGSHMINNGTIEIPDYQIIRDYLTEIVNNRFTSDVERSVLFLLSNGGKAFDDTIPDGISGLISKGLIKVDGNTYSIGIGYLLDYLKARKQDSSMPDDAINIENKERDFLVDEIKRLRNTVTQSYQDPPFIPSPEDPIEFDILKKECCDDAGLMAFATSLCKLYYEGSDKGKRLPSDFFSHDFCNMIQALRNKYDHTSINYEARQMDDNKLSSLINNGVWPYKKEHFANVQMNVLRMFREELLLMQDGCKKNAEKQEDRCIITQSSRFIVEGNYYEGVIVRHGSLLYVKCTQLSYRLPIIGRTESFYEGGIVVFKAIKEQNKVNPNKPFWKAGNVRLKNISK